MHLHEHEGKKAFVIVVLNVVITVSEVVAGILSGSLALVSDALHNLSDVLAVVLSFGARAIARRDSTSTHTYGYKRAEVLAAFVNALVLLGVAVLVGREAIVRLLSPVPVGGWVMIVVGGITFLANGLSTVLLHHEAHESLNMRSSYLHLFADTLFSLVVVIGGVILLWKPIFWLDPVLSLVIVVYIVKESWQVVKHTVDILMQAAVPVDYEVLQRTLEGVGGVKNVHHVHTWRTDEKTFYFEAHVEMEDCMLSSACEIGQQIETRLKDFGFSHVTLQYETDRCREKDFFVKKKS